jgi:DNA-binding response OmpR family regulator
MRVLAVEDNVKLAKMVQKGLKKNGYAVDVIHDGSEAAAHIFLNHSEYDVIILDLKLPNRSGLDICTAIRERQITTPIIVLTAQNEKYTVIQLLNAGADDYIAKPFAFEELVARVRAMLRRPKENLPSELFMNEIRLNTNTHRVSVQEKELVLTLKEFSILQLFLSNPERILTREFILDHVWDYNFNSLSNIVDVHVKNLRKKLDDSQKGDFIETVPGVGYRLKV